MSKFPLLTAISVAAFIPSAAFAATGDFSKIDVNADGKITLEEAAIVHPDWSSEAFRSLDTNADGSLSVPEYEAALASALGANEPTKATNSSDPAVDASDAVTNMRTDGPARYLDAVGPNDVLASTLIGMRVYAVESDVDDTKVYPADSRKDWSDVGEVNDVVLDWDGSVKAVVLGVGGFLGMGEKDVAIDISSFRKVREANDSNDWFLVVNSSKDMLSNAPAYVRNTKS